MVVSAMRATSSGRVAASSRLSAGDSGRDVHRHFCPQCGSGVWLECDSDPGYVFLKAGTLDDAGWVKPDMHIFTVSGQPWVEVQDSLPRYERMPPE